MQDITYLNTAAVGLVSPESVEAAQQFQEKTKSNAIKTFGHWMENSLPNLTEKTAALINAKASQIAFLPNFSFSISAIVQTIQPKINNVLLFKDDYPSLNMPFELGDFNISYVESEDGFSISLEAIKTICEENNIEAIAISHVQFLTGFTLDIEALGDFCKEEGIVLILDATQSMGTVEINFEESFIDVFISSSYKWLNGGLGSAVMCIKDSFMQEFPPHIAGFGSLDHSDENWNYQPSMASYQPGHLNAPGLLQLEKAIEKRLSDGIANIEEHNQSLIKKLASGLEDTSFKIIGGKDISDLSTILCFKAEQAVHDWLKEKNISVTYRKGAIRVSPHFYNTIKDIDHLLDVLKTYENTTKA
jgi:selenocysteine lyase/cysteine desulfurase